jgi:nucleotide-binding universal stress UspA family protein
MYKKILMAVDLAEADIARLILDTACAMPLDDDGEIHALTVVPTYGMAIVGSYFSEDFESKAIEAAQARLSAFLAENTPDGAIIKGHVAHGTIYDEIMRVANDLGCDLIIMASHRPELKDYLLGPNAARVVRHSKCSVMVVRE